MKTPNANNADICHESKKVSGPVGRISDRNQEGRCSCIRANGQVDNFGRGGMNEPSNEGTEATQPPFWQPYLPRQSTVSRTVSPLYVQYRLDAIKWASPHYHHTRCTILLLVFHKEGYRPVEGYVPRARTRPISFTLRLRPPLAPIARTNPFSLFLTCETDPEFGHQNRLCPRSDRRHW